MKKPKNMLAEDWPQDIQAHVALEVDVWVIDLGQTLDLGCFVRVRLTHLEAEHEAAAFVVTLEIKALKDYKIDSSFFLSNI